MSSALKKDDPYATPDQYLVGEGVSQTKHEFLAGMI